MCMCIDREIYLIYLNDIYHMVTVLISGPWDWVLIIIPIRYFSFLQFIQALYNYYVLKYKFRTLLLLILASNV